MRVFHRALGVMVLDLPEKDRRRGPPHLEKFQIKIQAKVKLSLVMKSDDFEIIFLFKKIQYQVYYCRMRAEEF